MSSTVSILFSMLHRNIGRVVSMCFPEVALDWQGFEGYGFESMDQAPITFNQYQFHKTGGNCTKPATKLFIFVTKLWKPWNP